MYHLSKCEFGTHCRSWAHIPLINFLRLEIVVLLVAQTWGSVGRPPATLLPSVIAAVAVVPTVAIAAVPIVTLPMDFAYALRGPSGLTAESAVLLYVH